MKKRKDKKQKLLKADDGLRIVTMASIEHSLPIAMFETLLTNTTLDRIFSDKGGLMRATIYIVVGEPGVGKSTVLTDVLNRIQVKDTKVLFVSSEEGLIDRAYNYKKSPFTGDVPTLFLNDYPNAQIKSKRKALETAFARGYDVIVIDSFKDVQDKILLEEDNELTRSQIETWLINLMCSVAAGANNLKQFTTFLCVQQINKGGTFVGSNSLKHNTTGMLEMRYDKTGRRYIEFTKNRRAGGMIKHKVYYTYDEDKHQVQYEEPVNPNPDIKIEPWDIDDIVRKAEEKAKEQLRFKRLKIKNR